MHLKTVSKESKNEFSGVQAEVCHKVLGVDLLFPNRCRAVSLGKKASALS